MTPEQKARADANRQAAKRKLSDKAAASASHQQAAPPVSGRADGTNASTGVGDAAARPSASARTCRICNGLVSTNTTSCSGPGTGALCPLQGQLHPRCGNPVLPLTFKTTKPWCCTECAEVSRRKPPATASISQLAFHGQDKDPPGGGAGPSGQGGGRSGEGSAGGKSKTKPAWSSGLGSTGQKASLHCARSHVAAHDHIRLHTARSREGPSAGSRGPRTRVAQSWCAQKSLDSFLLFFRTSAPGHAQRLPVSHARRGCLLQRGINCPR